MTFPASNSRALLAAALGMALAAMVLAATAGANGNSEAAKACQKGGYANLYKADGSPFANAGECTSYAAQGGALVTKKVATITNVSFRACNTLTLGYELDGVLHDLETKPAGCILSPPGFVGSDHTVEYFSNQAFRLFLRDETCNGWLFFQDEPHGDVEGDNPYRVRIMDAGGFCESPPDQPRSWTTSGFGNLDLILTIG